VELLISKLDDPYFCNTIKFYLLGLTKQKFHINAFNNS